MFFQAYFKILGININDLILNLDFFIITIDLKFYNDHSQKQLNLFNYKRIVFNYLSYR